MFRNGVNLCMFKLDQSKSARIWFTSTTYHSERCGIWSGDGGRWSNDGFRHRIYIKKKMRWRNGSFGDAEINITIAAVSLVLIRRIAIQRRRRYEQQQPAWYTVLVNFLIRECLFACLLIKKKMTATFNGNSGKSAFVMGNCHRTKWSIIYNSFFSARDRISLVHISLRLRVSGWWCLSAEFRWCTNHQWKGHFFLRGPPNKVGWSCVRCVWICSCLLIHLHLEMGTFAKANGICLSSSFIISLFTALCPVFRFCAFVAFRAMADSKNG